MEKRNEFLNVNEDVVSKVLENQPDDEYLYDLADLFKTFGDSTRIKILYALFEGELCVGDLATILQLSQPAISHQLKVLKDAKLVKFRREGKVIFYSLDDDHVRSILSIGMNCDGKPFVAYRVSSRSFPNRQCLKFDNRASIVPKEGFEKDIFENTYITYNCIRIVKDMAIVSNGSHTDVIADKIALGMNIKDAIAYSLLTLDYEKDDYHTPRIAGVVTSTNKKDDYICYVGIANDEKLLVDKIPYGEAVFISTYGSQFYDSVDFDAKTAEDAAKFIFDGGIFANYKKAVTAGAAVFDGEWNIGNFNP